jgi:hypothetical protein
MVVALDFRSPWHLTGAVWDEKTFLWHRNRTLEKKSERRMSSPLK